MSKRWLAAKAVFFGLSMITGASLLADVVGEKWAGLIVLGVAAVRGGMDFYEHGLATPTPEAWQGPTKQ